MKQALHLGAFSAANVLTAVLFQWLLLTLVGPGQETDALFAALTIPMIFATIIGTSLTQVLVPLFSGESAEQQYRDSWSLLNMCALLFFGITIVLELTAPYWTPLTVLGFTPEAKKLTLALSHISILGMLFTGVNSVQIAFAFARQSYVWVDAASIIANTIAVISLIIFLPIYDIYAAAWISILRLLIQTLFLMRGMGRWSALNIHSPILAEAWIRIRPMLIGSSYYKMDPLIDRFLLSSLTPGSISLLYFAQQFYNAGSQVITKIFAVPAITRLSALYKNSRRFEFLTDLKRTLLVMLISIFIILLLIVFFGLPVLRAIMEYGSFEEEDSKTLWILLLLLSGQLVGGSMGALISGAFYSIGDTRTPTIIGCIIFTLNIFIKIIFFKFFGFFGLVVSISIFYVLASMLMILKFFVAKRVSF